MNRYSSFPYYVKIVHWQQLSNPFSYYNILAKLLFSAHIIKLPTIDLLYSGVHSYFERLICYGSYRSDLQFFQFYDSCFSPIGRKCYFSSGDGGRNLTYFQICFSTGIVHKNSKNVFL